MRDVSTETSKGKRRGRWSLSSGMKTEESRFVGSWATQWSLSHRRCWKSATAISISYYPALKVVQYSFRFFQKLVVGLNLRKTSTLPEVMATEWDFCHIVFFSHGPLWECQWGLEAGVWRALGELNLPAHLSLGKGAVPERKEINWFGSDDGGNWDNWQVIQGLGQRRG